MTLLDNWFAVHLTQDNVAELFSENELVLGAWLRGPHRKLRRSKSFDALMIKTVEEGLLTDTWEGIVYVMHWRCGDQIVPLYVGKAERRGIR